MNKSEPYTIDTYSSKPTFNFVIPTQLMANNATNITIVVITHVDLDKNGEYFFLKNVYINFLSSFIAYSLSYLHINKSYLLCFFLYSSHVRNATNIVI